MTPFQCSLCGSERYLVDRRLDTQRLVDVYSRSFGVDVRKYLPAPELVTARCTRCDMRTHTPCVPGESGFYDRMNAHSFYYEWQKAEFDYAVAQALRLKPERILDVGCGEGLFLERIATGFDVRGSEYSEAAIAKLKAKQIALDGEGDTYDFVTNFQVIEHVPDVRAFVQFCLDKLRPGGHLFIATVNHDSPIMREGLDVLDYPPHHLTQWSAAALKNLAPLFDLELVDYFVEPPRLNHYTGLIASRRATMLGPGAKGAVLRLLGSALDRVLAPYFLDHMDVPGASHGVLLRKLDDAAHAR